MLTKSCEENHVGGKMGFVWGQTHILLCLPILASILCQDK